MIVPLHREGRSAVCALAISVVLVGSSFAQEPASPHAKTATPLAELLREAEHNNPQLQALRQGSQALRHVPVQVSTLPDPQIQVQQFNVGSPRPFAGYTNSNFAYVGMGISQGIPYPGKLQLRGAVSSRDADIADNHADSASLAVLAEVKSAYLQIARQIQTLAVLEHERPLFRQIEQAAEARYRSGMGNQQDVLRAQLQETKLLQDIVINRLETGKIQARLKQLLNRPQSSADIIPVALEETRLATPFDELLSAVQAQNPDLTATQNRIERQTLQVGLARKDFYPDFNVGFKWMQTDPARFRGYYLFTLGITVPIHYDKQRRELAQAEAELSRSQSERAEQLQQLAAELSQQHIITRQTAELLTITREGLLPQARAAVQAGLAGYRNNRQDFQTLLAAALDLLRLEQEYWQTLADHEIAIAHTEQLTGLSLLSAAKE